MKATTPIASTPARQGHSTGAVCCGVPTVWVAMGGCVPTAWAAAYQHAYATAVAEVAFAAHRRRSLGHFEPSLN